MPLLAVLQDLWVKHQLWILFPMGNIFASPIPIPLCLWSQTSLLVTQGELDTEG